MDARLQRRVQRYGWDRASAHYERYWRRQLVPAQKSLLELAELGSGERVVDIACGTGLVTFPAIVAVGPTGLVLGTDISDRMVESGAAEARARGLTNVRFERMDAEDLRLPDQSFDAALCALGLMFCVDPLQASREMHRVLRLGGRAVAAVWGARKNCGWAEVFPIVEARVHSDVCPLFFQMGTGQNLRETFEAAGLTSVVSERIATTLSFDSAEDALGAAFLGGAVAMAYSRFDQGTRDEVHAEYLASVAAYRSGEAYRVPGEFVVARGERR